MPLASEILPLTRSVAHCPPVAHGPCWSPLPPPTANRPRPSAFPSPIPSPHRPNPSSPLTLPCSQIRSKNLHSFFSGPWEEDEIRRDRVEPQSVSLSWREPIPAGASGANGTEYEIRYYEKVGPVPEAPGSRSQVQSVPWPAHRFLLFTVFSQQNPSSFPNIPPGLRSGLPGWSFFLALLLGNAPLFLFPSDLPASLTVTSISPAGPGVYSGQRAFSAG